MCRFGVLRAAKYGISLAVRIHGRRRPLWIWVSSLDPFSARVVFLFGYDALKRNEIPPPGVNAPLSQVVHRTLSASGGQRLAETLQDRHSIQDRYVPLRLKSCAIRQRLHCHLSEVRIRPLRGSCGKEGHLQSCGGNGRVADTAMMVSPTHDGDDGDEGVSSRMVQRIFVLYRDN